MGSEIFLKYTAHKAQIICTFFFLSFLLALDSLGFGEYTDDVKNVVQEAKAVAAKKRRASTKLENLGIPEEELLRQQQELFAKVNTYLILKVFLILPLLFINLCSLMYNEFYI